jgi:hypothetical protein
MKRSLFAAFILFALLPATSCSTADLSATAETSSAKPDKPLMGNARQLVESASMESPLAATVLGENIYTNDPVEMQDILLTRLFNRYAEENGITASDAEIDAFVEEMRRDMRARGLAAEDDLTPEEAAQARQMHRDMGRAIIRQWKLNRALYQQFDGRIIYQQLGPEPIDAYRQYLEQNQAAGNFKIYRKDFENEFWRYFTTDALHDFYEPGSIEEAQAFKTPPWQSTALEEADAEMEKATDEERPALLMGTRWRLVKFQSMDDAIGEIRPENVLIYTMALNGDGTVQMQLNCNRAVGTWSADPATDDISGRFTFGPLATTKALCPQPSMDERIARDAEWIRGYLLRDGQLHLSLMADGGIYSWEPVSEDDSGGSFATQPDPVLEEALRTAAPDYTLDVVSVTGWEARYVYGRFDLNADGRQEVLVLLMGSIFCGTGGCNLLLFSQSDEGYQLINNFPISRLPVIASPETTAGWHDLIRRESGGGVPPSYVRHFFNGETYIEQERLPAETTPDGTHLLDGDYSYATGFPLVPGK